jgi:hypothetical protein
MKVYQLVLVAMVAASEAAPSAEHAEQKQEVKKEDKGNIFTNTVKGVQGVVKGVQDKFFFLNHCMENGIRERCFKAKDMLEEADDHAEKLFEEVLFPKGSPMQAKITDFEHCYWGGLMTRKFGLGPETGMVIAKMRASKSKNGETELKWNTIGIEFGKKYKEKEEISKYCLEATLLNGPRGPSKKD